VSESISNSNIFSNIQLIAAAPYAERYLGLLSEREGQRHYFEADLTTCTKNLHAKKLFLLHGTLEEKYHVTHSMLIAKSLIDKRFSFQQQVIFLVNSHFG